MLIEDHVDEYAELKRALGYKFTEQEGTLRRFAQFADSHGDAFVTEGRVVQWASMAPSPRRSAAWLSVVRNFAITLHAEDDRHDVPSPEIFGRQRKRRPRPHILAQDDISKILEAALEIGPHASINPYTYHYLFGLAAVCGLRASELVNLHMSDLTSDGLLIRETKFRKTRLVPVHESTRDALRRYLLLRRKIGGADPHLFVISTGDPTDRSAISKRFVQLTRKVGLRGPKGESGPRFHDLRHSFAVRSFETCGEGADDVRRHMTALSTYLGHANPHDTYWYLEATPKIYRQIAQAAEALHLGRAV